MYRIAQFVVRHKVGAVAVIALGVFFMTPNEGEEQPQSNSPWAVQSASSQVVEADAGFVDKMVDGAVAYLDENDLNPLDRADEAVGRLDQTASAYGAVNASNSN